MANDLKLNLILKATDTMSSVVKSACHQSDDAFNKMNERLEKSADKFDNAGKKALVVGGILTGISSANIKMAGDFERDMNNISTLIDSNVENITDMSNEVLKMAKDSPKALNDLASGLYSIRSAGIDVNDQYKVLHGSEMLSVAGLSTTAEAVDIATSAINAFNLKGSEGDRIYDMFFKVVKYGKTNISEFSQGFGSVMGVVSSANIELDEYCASVAAMTTSGLKANIAHTQLKAAIAGLSRGSKEQMAIFDRLGAKSFNQLVIQSGDMVNAFSRIYKAAGGNQSKLIQLVGSIEGYNAILSLTGANNKTYLQTLNDMRYGGDSLTEAYRKQTSGLNSQMSIIKNNVQALSIKFGNSLLPVVKMAGDGISKLSSLFDEMPDGMVNFISIATAGIGVISMVAGSGIMLMGGLIRNFILLREVMRTTSILSWANPALLPIIAVAGVVIGLGAAIVFAYNKFEGFRNMCQGVWAVVKAGGALIAVLTNSFINGAGALWNIISPAAKFTLTIMSWITPIGLAYHAIKGLVNIIGSLIEKAGGFRGIGNWLKNKGEDWEKAANEVNTSVKNQRETKKVDGSHADGLDYVPYDGYIAETHKGEAILTKDEADIYRNGSLYGINANYGRSMESVYLTIDFKPNITIGSNTQQSLKEEFMKLLKEYKDEITRLVLEILKRREVRVY